jgi:peroxiredoxin
VTHSTWPYPAPRDDGAACHLVPGLSIPDVALASTCDDRVNLGRRRGRAVVFVYPWAGRPGVPNPPGWDDIPGAHGSTPEAAGFRDLYEHFHARNVAVFGLSGQTQSEQREFAARLELPFPLLCDEKLQFADLLRLPRFETGGRTYLSRLTLAVSDGHLEAAFYPVHPPDTHAAEVLGRL